MSEALLLSGGMDSVAIAYWRKPSLAITIDYGQQPAAGEIRAARSVCKALSIEHCTVTTNIAQLGSGDLAGNAPSNIAPASEWWPYRNQFLITLGGMTCLPRGIETLLIGALRTDGFHIDGTPRFIDAMNMLFDLQEGTLAIVAPAIALDAVELVRTAGVPIEILSWAHSCHTAEHACGFCRGCRKHYETMQALGYEPY